MCIQYYECYNLCPCQLKYGPLDECSDPSTCHNTAKPVYSANKPYCAYHARKNLTCTTARRLFFERMDVPSPTSLNIPAHAPILGRIIGGQAQFCAFAGSEVDFGFLPISLHRIIDDSSDDSDLGKPPVDQKRWDFSREEDRLELEERKEDFWSKMATPGGAYWEPSARARRGPWGSGPMKTGREKSRTWVEWKKVQRAKKKAQDKVKGEEAKQKGDDRLKISVSETNEVKEESQLLSTTELEEYEAIMLSESMTKELMKSWAATPGPKPRDNSSSGVTKLVKDPGPDGT
ncbi:hypothetical protein F4805DRAFT_434848 [Annulohypoxylon moriforme]|nr:hypothetical protein F4805DRAFT_434848 [Annulohypoxylon moriforme]